MLFSVLLSRTMRLAPIYRYGKPRAMLGTSLVFAPMIPSARSAVVWEATRSELGIKSTTFSPSLLEDRQGKSFSTKAESGPRRAAAAGFTVVKSSETIRVMIDEDCGTICIFASSLKEPIHIDVAVFFGVHVDMINSLDLEDFLSRGHGAFQLQKDYNLDHNDLYCVFFECYEDIVDRVHGRLEFAARRAKGYEDGPQDDDHTEADLNFPPNL